MLEIKGAYCKLYVGDKFIGESEATKCRHDKSNGISINEINADGRTYKVGETTEIDGEQYMVDSIKAKGNKVSIGVSMKIDAPIEDITFEVKV